MSNRQITISTAGSRRSTAWPASTLFWSEFIEKLKTPVRSVEKMEEYLALSKTKQGDLKDVGGFVGGTFKNSRRKAENVLLRDLVTLDADSIEGAQLDSILKHISGLGCDYAVYSTRKHLPEKPRIRVIVPLDAPVGPEEYEAIARKLAEMIGMEFFDPTTFEPSRLMFWPSVCADGEYLYYTEDKALLSASGMLALYPDWRNAASWPQVPGTPERQQKLADRQGNPLEKTGVVGAFCRAFDIYRTMDELIPGVYAPCDIPGRYTYTEGSTTGGAVVYDSGNFLYSHHSTDPAGSKLCNSFDLARIHLFGERDDDVKPETPTNRLPSFTAMTEYALNFPAVTLSLTQENHAKAMEAFSTPVDATDTNWMAQLAISANTGLPAKTIDNALLILCNDAGLKGKIAYDDFARRLMALGSLPWNPETKRRVWNDADDASLTHYLEKAYRLSIAEKKLENAVTITSQRNAYNDVQSYLMRTEWDGVARLDTWLFDYYGCADNAYTRAVSRKGWTAAVARAMVPGCKYDCMPIMVGDQGTFKSTGLHVMGGEYYSDSLTTFEGKEAAEQLQGVLVCEVAELASASRSETNVVKQMLSRRTDRFRLPYGRRTGEFPRTVVFWGTTNDKEFLRDSTGERRYWPVDIRETTPTKDVRTQMPLERDQLWAEAFIRWQLGEYLDLEGSAKEIWEKVVKEHKITNTKEGLILDFLERPVPVDWHKRGIQNRRLYWASEHGSNATETYERRTVCAVELWTECFSREAGQMKQTDAREINAILEGLDGWKRIKSLARFGPYGHQRGFEKVLTKSVNKSVNTVNTSGNLLTEQKIESVNRVNKLLGEC